MKKPVHICRGDPLAPGARALIEASHDLMRALFPAESNHFFSLDELGGENVLFFTATLDNTTVGCAALVLCDGYAEVKSMFVDPAARGAKVGLKLLEYLEAEANACGRSTLRLETGDKLIAAQMLYRSHGYEICAPFGDYKDDPLSVFMEKKL